MWSQFDSSPVKYTGWVCCWFLFFLPGLFTSCKYSGFPPFTKTNISKLQFNLDWARTCTKPTKADMISLWNIVKYLLDINFMWFSLWERPMPPDTSLYHLSQDLFFFWQLPCSGSLPPMRMVGNFNGYIIKKGDEFSWTLKVNREFFKAKLSTIYWLSPQRTLWP